MIERFFVARIKVSMVPSRTRLRLVRPQLRELIIGTLEAVQLP